MKPITSEQIEAEKKAAEKPEYPEKPKNMKAFDVFVDGEYFKVEVADKNARVVNSKNKKKIEKSEDSAISGNLIAPIPGMIIDYKKKVGDVVKAGETVVVLEAMKMYNNLGAPCDGEIKNIVYKAGDSVTKGDILCRIEPAKK